MLHAINELEIATTKGTEATLASAKYFINYATSNPDAELYYQDSEIIIRVDSYGAYMVCPQVCITSGGYHFLRNKYRSLLNAPIFLLENVIKLSWHKRRKKR